MVLDLDTFHHKKPCSAANKQNDYPKFDSFNLETSERGIIRHT